MEALGIMGFIFGIGALGQVLQLKKTVENLKKEVDELIVLDIDATVENRSPNYELIKNLATECRMPFCYGGGITTIEQAKKIIELGGDYLIWSNAPDDPYLN